MSLELYFVWLMFVLWNALQSGDRIALCVTGVATAFALLGQCVLAMQEEEVSVLRARQEALIEQLREEQ